MRFTNPFERARFAVLSLCLATLGLAWSAPQARAQAIAPYLFADCEGQFGQMTTIDQGGSCATQAQFMSGGQNPAPLFGHALAMTPDGTRVFLGMQAMIQVYQRDPVSGALTYESCISDGSAVAPVMVTPCTRTQPYQLAAPSDPSSYLMWLSVSPDGSTLYASSQKLLSVLSIGTSSPSLALSQCWARGSEVFYQGANPVCGVIDTGVTGAVDFDNVQSPAVSPGGTDVYVAVTAIQDSSTPTMNYRGAVLRFSRDTTSGNLSYADCAGMLGTLVITYNGDGSVNTVTRYAVPCADSSLDMRNLRRVQVSPDGGSVYVTGSASDVQYNTDAIARLGRATGGTLSFAQCTLLPTAGACVPGGGTGAMAGPDEILVGPESQDVYVNTYQAVHLRLTAGTLAISNDISAPGGYAGFLNGRRYALDPTGTALFVPSNGGSAQLTVFDRNTSTGALTYRGCAASSYNYSSPPCDPFIVGYGGDFIGVAPQGGAMITYGTGGIPGGAYGTGPLLVSFAAGKQLTVTAGANGTVTSSPGHISCGTTCQDTFPSGTSVSLAATPAATYTFDSWSGDCTGSTSPCSLTMDANKNVGAAFKKIQYSMTVTAAAGGTITSSIGGINCGTTCSASFDIGSSVTLYQTPDAGYVFVGWTGDCAGAFSTGCALLMNSNRSVGATFALVTPAAPTNFNAIVTALKTGKKTTYTGTLSWTETSTNVTGFLIQRYTKSHGSCAIDTKFGTQTVAASVLTYTDSTASASTCGYQVAAQNVTAGGTYTSAYTRDMNIGSGVTP